MRSIVGENVLTILLAGTQEQGVKMFFCPYTQNKTLQYQGEVKAILPGFDAEESPQVILKPQRTPENIHYTFTDVPQDASNTVDFWIQDQYFIDTHIKTYFCFNCQISQLYFSSNKVVHFDSKAEVQRGERYTCRNPNCKQGLIYQGIVKIQQVTRFYI